MRSDHIYKLATQFSKLCFGEFIVDKQWIFDHFFRRFKQKYHLIYDFFRYQNEEQSTSTLGNLYGPKVQFKFLDRTKDEPEDIIETVEMELKDSPMGKYIHSVHVTPESNHVYVIEIIFNLGVSQIEGAGFTAAADW